MTSLADKAILSGADNRSPMLEKDMYDSWKSRMELYMLNKKCGRMILESVEQGPLLWPTVEEDGVTRLKKYSELSAAKAIQADFDVKATNFILLSPPITLESLQEQLQQLQQTILTVLTNQSVVNTEIQALKNEEGNSNRRGSQTHNTQYVRMSKIEILKFHREDVKRWVYRCKQFFKIDGIEEERKVGLASMHLYDQALVWHQQYVKKYEDRTPWEMYEGEVVKRFGAIYKDHIVDLKNLK
nr:hypothetical protein [Tanacetum cinerariifolium]